MHYFFYCNLFMAALIAQSCKSRKMSELRAGEQLYRELYSIFETETLEFKTNFCNTPQVLFFIGNGESTGNIFRASETSRKEYPDNYISTLNQKIKDSDAKYFSLILETNSRSVESESKNNLCKNIWKAHNPGPVLVRASVTDGPNTKSSLDSKVKIETFTPDVNGELESVSAYFCANDRGEIQVAQEEDPCEVFLPSLINNFSRHIDDFALRKFQNRNFQKILILKGHASRFSPVQEFGSVPSIYMQLLSTKFAGPSIGLFDTQRFPSGSPKNEGDLFIPYWSVKSICSSFNLLPGSSQKYCEENLQSYFESIKSKLTLTTQTAGDDPFVIPSSSYQLSDSMFQTKQSLSSKLYYASGTSQSFGFFGVLDKKIDGQRLNENILSYMGEKDFGIQFPSLIKLVGDGVSFSLDSKYKMKAQLSSDFPTTFLFDNCDIDFRDDRLQDFFGKKPDIGKALILSSLFPLEAKAIDYDYLNSKTLHYLTQIFTNRTRKDQQVRLLKNLVGDKSSSIHQGLRPLSVECNSAKCFKTATFKAHNSYIRDYMTLFSKVEKNARVLLEHQFEPILAFATLELGRNFADVFFSFLQDDLEKSFIAGRWTFRFDVISALLFRPGFYSALLLYNDDIQLEKRSYELLLAVLNRLCQKIVEALDDVLERSSEEKLNGFKYLQEWKDLEIAQLNVEDQLLALDFSEIPDDLATYAYYLSRTNGFIQSQNTKSTPSVTFSDDYAVKISEWRESLESNESLLLNADFKARFRKSFQVELESIKKRY